MLKLRILLISNYKGDKQESMDRYAILVQQELAKLSHEIKLIYPPIFFGIFFTNQKVNKWIGYLDKYLIAPFYFLFVSNFSGSYDIIHICDHSNAIYRRLFKPQKLVITCHDVLAIRGALGFSDAHCMASKTGILLQKFIVANLTKIDKIACVSKTTLKQLNELSPIPNNEKRYWKYVPNTFNQNFEPIEISLLTESLSKFKLKYGNYLLHVGSDLERKNRQLLLNLLSIKTEIRLVVTQPFKSDLPGYVSNSSNITVLTNLTSSNLAAIYQGAMALVFPSLAEGFGWPIIEAQKSGIPVICSDIPIHREIAGDAAIFVNSKNPEDWAEAVDSLNDPEKRGSLVLKGFENIKKYSSQIFTEELLSLYTSNEICH